jgi:hypothetical protein
LQDAVVVIGVGEIAECIARFANEQVVRVIGDERLGTPVIGMKGIAVAMRQEEVLAGVRELLRNRVVRLGGEEHAARRNPPVAVVVPGHVASVDGQHGVGRTSAVNCGHQS